MQESLFHGSAASGGDSKSNAPGSPRTAASSKRQPRNNRVFSADALSNPARMAALAAMRTDENKVEYGGERHMRVVQARQELPLPPLMVTSQRGEAKATTVRLPTVKPKAPRKSATFGYKDPAMESFAQQLAAERPHRMLSRLLRYADFKDSTDVEQSTDPAAREKEEQRTTDLSFEFEPPRLDLAERYASALHPRRIHSMSGVRQGVPVCRSQVGRHCRRGWAWINPFCESDRSEFDRFGLGVALYFRLLKWMGWTMVAMSVISAPMLVLNVQASHSAYSDARGFASPVADLGLWRTTLGGLGQASNASQVDLTLSGGVIATRQRLSLGYGFLDFIACCVFLCSLLWLTSSVDTMRRRVQRTTLSVDRFTVQLRSVPADATEAEVASWIERVTGEKVQEVVIVENVYTVLNTLKERFRLRAQLAAAHTKRRTILALAKRLQLLSSKACRLESGFTDETGRSHATHVRSAMRGVVKPVLPLVMPRDGAAAGGGGGDSGSVSSGDAGEGGGAHPNPTPHGPPPPTAGVLSHSPVMRALAGLGLLGDISAVLEEDSGGEVDSSDSDGGGGRSTTQGTLGSTDSMGSSPLTGDETPPHKAGPDRHSAAAPGTSAGRVPGTGLALRVAGARPPPPGASKSPLAQHGAQASRLAAPAIVGTAGRARPPPPSGGSSRGIATPNPLAVAHRKSPQAPASPSTGAAGGVGGAVASAVRRVRQSITAAMFAGRATTKQANAPAEQEMVEISTGAEHEQTAIPSAGGGGGAMRAGGAIPPAPPYVLEVDMKMINTQLHKVDTHIAQLRKALGVLARRRDRIALGVEDEDAPTRDMLRELGRECWNKHAAPAESGGACSVASPLAVPRGIEGAAAPPIASSILGGGSSAAAAPTSQRAVTAFVSFKSVGAVRTAQELLPDNPLVATCCTRNNAYLKLRGEVRGRAVAAPMPSTVRWENYGFTPRQVSVRQCITAVPIALILVVSCVLWYGARQAQITSSQNRVGNRLAEDMSCGPVATVQLDAQRFACDCGRLPPVAAATEPACAQWQAQRSTGVGVTILVAVLVLGMNEVITVLTSMWLPFERHHTVGGEDVSYFSRLTLRIVLNVLLMNIIVNANWWRVLDLWGISTDRVKAGAGNVIVTEKTADGDGTIDGSLLELGSNAPWDYPPQWYANVGTMCIFLLILYVFTSQAVPLGRVALAALRRRNTPAFTQTELNKQRVGPVFSLAEHHARAVSIVWMGFVLSAGVPLLLPLSALVLLVTYWVDKFALLRLHRLPPLYDATVNFAATGSLWWALLFHVIMALYMYSSGDILNSTDSTAGGRVGQNIIASTQSFSGTVGRFFAVHTSGHILLLCLLFSGWALSQFSVALPDVVYFCSRGRYCAPQNAHLHAPEMAQAHGDGGHFRRTGRRATIEALTLVDARARGMLLDYGSYKLVDNLSLRQVLGISKGEFAALEAKFKSEVAAEARREGGTLGMARGDRAGRMSAARRR